MEHLEPKAAAAFLKDNPEALFVDCRSEMEYLFVGHPVGALHVAWNDGPDWAVNPHVTGQVKRLAGTNHTKRPIVLICRSGNRSQEAGQALELAGFTEVVERDAAGKLRIFDSWGWFLDVDVWQRQPREKENAEAEARVQMVSGKHGDKSIYSLPAAILLPPTEVDLPDFANVPLGVPADASAVLKYWYGPDWRTPRKFDKGRDESTDRVEVFFWRYGTFLYECFCACKAIAIFSFNLLRFHALLAALLALSAYACSVAVRFFASRCYAHLH